jgi:NADPH:quinone reductase-like Zn-dependent oxidoreductase
VKALTISAHGGLERVEFRDDLPVPQLQRPGDVRVRVIAAALNHLDLFVVEGLPGVRITPPWIMGADATGIIDVVGDGVKGVSVGDRVVINGGIACRVCEYCLAGEQSLCVKFQLLGEHLPGTFAEYIVVPATNVRRIPADRARLGDAAAAAFTLATLTAWRMVVTRAVVKPGEQVLIQGIGGGVAVAALQVAKLRGARAWVTSSSDEKLAKAAALGADETINYRTTDVARAVRDRTGKRGVDVVIDSAGHASWAQSLGALGRGGRLVTCGGTTGPSVETDVRKLFWNQWTLMGSTMGNDAEFDAIAAELAAGRLIPPVDSVFPLADGRAALERMAGGQHFGKIVLEIGSP